MNRNCKYFVGIYVVITIYKGLITSYRKSPIILLHSANYENVQLSDERKVLNVARRKFTFNDTFRLIFNTSCFNSMPWIWRNKIEFFHTECIASKYTLDALECTIHTWLNASLGDAFIIRQGKQLYCQHNEAKGFLLFSGAGHGLRELLR